MCSEYLRACGACRVTPGQVPGVKVSAIPEPIVISEPNVDESIEFESVEPVSCNSEDSCVAEEDVSNNITDDDEDDDDSVDSIMIG
ncbi:hypothetical protein EVAR_43525_1 [Eumeta japonica]|uniref:Uncharacterized protein n=1 Tax=Eumeta variegata TaxID=151549 RepID=A0A4C1WCF1_EUMVA|nr:hypothetical protein EVAR_43525_1 [Eumeta japonica]